MPCGCLGKKVIYNSLTNMSLPSQNQYGRNNNQQNVRVPRQRITWEMIQKDLKKLK